MQRMKGFDARAQALIAACLRAPWEVGEIARRLETVDVNQAHADHPEVSILSVMFELYTRHCRRDADAAWLAGIVDRFVRSGFDTRAYGAMCVGSLQYVQAQEGMLRAAKRILDGGVRRGNATWRWMQDCLAHAEGCLHQDARGHARENDLFALREILRAYEGAAPYRDIHSFRHAVGRRITGAHVAARQAGWMALDARAGQLRFGGAVALGLGTVDLVIHEAPTLVCRPPQAGAGDEAAPLDERILGRRVVGIDFGHRTVTRGRKAYAQPNLRIGLDNGHAIVCTTNFGEGALEDTAGVAWVEAPV